MSSQNTGQSPLVKAYFELVDASGMTDEEFSQAMEAAAEELPRCEWSPEQISPTNPKA